MEKILFLSNVEENGTLGKPALEALAAAASLASSSGGTFAAALTGENVLQAAEAIGSCGASKFFGISSPLLKQSRFKTDATAAEKLCREAEATIIVAPCSSRWARVLGAVAFRLNGRFDSHVTGLSVSEGKVKASRWFYRQRIETVFERTKRPWFILLESGSAAAWEGPAKAVSLSSIDLGLTDGDVRTTVQGFQQPAADEQTIRPDAETLFVAGAGWTKKQADGQSHIGEASELILDFLRKTHSSLGSSKSLVDMDSEGEGVLPFLSHLNQIGQTGATPRHPKGLATCCHGEEPHVVGWRFINERRAINLNPNCGWAQGKADVLYVADAFQVMTEVNKLLGK